MCRATYGKDLMMLVAGIFEELNDAQMTARRVTLTGLK